MKRILIILALAVSTPVFCQQTPLEIPLWPHGAPGFESRRNEPTQAKDWWVKNIHNPSVTVYAPSKDKSTGTAVIICPGGGHRELVFNAEGKEAAEFLNSIGVTAFVLKYRLAKEKNTLYIRKKFATIAYRAMRLVRSRAKMECGS